MQVVRKIEQPNSPCSSSSYSSPITPKSSKDFMQIITKLLEQGQQSAQHIRRFLNERVGLKGDDLDHHSLVVLNSFKDALCIAKRFDLDEEDVMIRKRKLDCTNNIESLDHSSSGGTISKDRRGCYKRRKSGQTWTLEGTDLVDDGHSWRKYGQKDILNTKFPRNYYRCTHKHDQECQATKQVQQISENPTKYNIIYNGIHTCKNLHKTTSIIIDPEQQNSSFFLSFQTNHNNYPTPLNNTLINSSNLFPSSSAFHISTTPASMVKQEYTSAVKEELPISQSPPHDLDHGTHSNLHQSSSSSENLPCSSDLTTSTPISDQGCCDSFEYGYDEDDLFNLINIGNAQIQLDDILKDY